MIIELKLTADQIFAVSKLTHQVYYLMPTICTDEIEMRSIMYDVADKFMSKHKSIIKKGNVFDKKKEFKMSLKFIEAKRLCVIIMDLIHTVNDVYYHTILDRIKNELHKKTI